MKTILNHHGFMKRFKVHCARERIELFYLKTCLAKALSIFRRPRIYMQDDYGDEVFDALYATLQDLGLRLTKNLSPYDVVEMKPIFRDMASENGKVKKYAGMLVTFKDFDARTFVKKSSKE